MGTPDFAVASLDALVQANFNVVAVVTAPDKPAGRGQKLNESAVKRYAVEKNMPILQPEKLKSPQFLADLKAYQADLQVVVAFRMLPEVVWNMPPKGTINLHGSLLPQYRGAAPINHAIINGEKESGVTTFFLTHQIDTGNIIFSDKTPIKDDETAGELHDKLMHIGAKLLVKTVQAIADNHYHQQPQPEEQTLKHAPKIFKDDCKINWQQSTAAIYNLIRGLSPYPTAFTLLNDKTLKIFKAEKVHKTPQHTPGTWHSDGKSYLQFATTDGYIKLLDIQYEGKKRMPIEDFLRGMRL